MPTYVYKFLETGETIEVQQSFDDAALTEAIHPVTGAAMAVKKVFLPVGITFKGGGFYKTDSRSGSSGGSKSPGTASSGSPDAGASSSSSESGTSSRSSGTASTPAPATASSD